MFPEWELNQQPFGSQAGTLSTEPHQPGLLEVVRRIKCNNRDRRHLLVPGIPQALNTHHNPQYIFMENLPCVRTEGWLEQKILWKGGQCIISTDMQKWIISKREQPPGWLSFPQPMSHTGVPALLRGLPLPLPLMLLHKVDNLLFTVGLVWNGHRLVHESFIEINLVQLQGQLLCHLW